MASIADDLRDFILTRYLPGESPTNLRNDMPLRTSGILDSLGTLAIISFIEQQYGIEVEAHETGVENFDRIDDIVAFIDRKRAQV